MSGCGDVCINPSVLQNCLSKTLDKFTVLCYNTENRYFIERCEYKVEMREVVGGKYLEYKGKPLVREGDTICYGDMEDKCILILEIMSHKTVDGADMPDQILIQVVDPKNQANILRQGFKSGLYEAFNLGLIWLEHELKKVAE